jgi:SAM-dependent methyltransferase
MIHRPDASAAASRIMPLFRRTFLPRRFYERLQIERFPIIEFVRDHGLTDVGASQEVLDAGSGHLSEQHQREEIVATGATLVTCDLNPGPGVDVVADISKMPFEDGRFDLVLCTQVLEHVKKPATVISEVFRVTKPGGAAIFTAPQSSPLHNLPWNFFNYTNLGLRLLLEEAGFEVEVEKAQGGYFALLAADLHWSVKEVRRRQLPPLIKVPLVWFCRAVFGFLIKVPLVWLDRFDPEPLHTIGWCFKVRKPASHQI